MNRRILNRRSLVAIIALMVAVLMPASLTLVYAGNSNTAVVASQGAKAWQVAWWQWALSIPYSSNPIFDTTGANCGVGQSGPVWFLAGTNANGFNGDTVTRNCTIPAGKALFFPIINVEDDYPCPDPNFHPSPHQSLVDFLTNGNSSFWGAKQFMDQVTTLNVEVDGVPMQNLFDTRVASPLFWFKADPSLTATFDSCFTGDWQQAVSDGYWVTLAPFSAGNHTIHFRGVAPSLTWGLDVTYNLTVQ